MPLLFFIICSVTTAGADVSIN